jgi:glycosyltransferase involved in cell wall biosynthesis
MVQDGHTVFIFCAGAFMGGYVEYEPGVTVVGAGGGDDRWGNRTWPEIVDFVNPDLIFTWLDVHGMPAYGWSEAPTYFWAPIDTHPIPKEEVEILNRGTKILCPSVWGQGVLKDDGLDSTYVPCGVDTKVYDIDSEGGQRWRAQISPAIDDDTFLVGMVGLNTGVPDRKGYGYAFDVIRQFVDNHPDEKISAYMHTDVYGDGMAINLLNLRDRTGLRDVIAFNPPQLPWGRPPLYMRDMYNAFDVYLTTSITEGFGVPVVEAQACGTPVVVNACSSVTELSMGPGGYRSKYLAEMWINTCSKVYIPDVDDIVQELEKAYADWKRKRHDPAAIRASVIQFDLDTVYDTYWRPLFEDVPPRINYEKAGGALGPKLLLGAGNNIPVERENWVLHDKEKYRDSVDVAWDLTKFPWPVEDDTYGYIEAEDVFEHLRADLTDVMNECYRILKPGGYLYIRVPEAGSWQLMRDPTHVVGFQPQSFDYYDPETDIGKHYVYSDKGWKIIKRTANNGGLVFVMQTRKEPTRVTFVEHFPDETGEHVPEKCKTCQEQMVTA